MNESFAVVLYWLMTASPVLIVVAYGWWFHWRPYKAQRQFNQSHLDQINALIEAAKREEKAGK